MTKIHQKVLGYVIPKGVHYSIANGWSETIDPTEDLEIEFEIDEFGHIIVAGATTKGKGVFCSNFGCYMMERYKTSFCDFNDQHFFENACYHWPQDNPLMLARLQDSFFMEPHGYPLEVYFPNGTQKTYPSFFKPYTIGWRDIKVMDLNIFDKHAEENLKLASDLEKCPDIREFLILIGKFSPQAFGFFKILKQTGILAEETNLDFDMLNDYKTIHSFTTSGLPDLTARQALSNILLRMIYDARINSESSPCLFYIREAAKMDQDFLRFFATDIRHVNLNLMVDAQRRTKLIDPTAGQQFSSQVLFQVGQSEGKDLFEDFGLPQTGYDNESGKPVNLLRKLEGADKGIALMRLVGSEPVFPFAVSPPVCSYRTKNGEHKYPNFFNLCKEHEEEMIEIS